MNLPCRPSGRGICTGCGRRAVGYGYGRRRFSWAFLPLGAELPAWDSAMAFWSAVPAVSPPRFLRCAGAAMCWCMWASPAGRRSWAFCWVPPPVRWWPVAHPQPCAGSVSGGAQRPAENGAGSHLHRLDGRRDRRHHRHDAGDLADRHHSEHVRGLPRHGCPEDPIDGRHGRQAAGSCSGCWCFPPITPRCSIR